MSSYRPIPELLSLHGKVALVTGGAMGIGLGIATRLAEAGANVVLADVDIRAAQDAALKLDSLAAEMQSVSTRLAKATTGDRVFAVKVDVSSATDVKRAISETIAKFGRLDIVVNNAGIYPMTPVLDLSEATWDKTIGVNLKGTFLVAQAAAQEMVREGHGGVIVNIASIDAFHPTGALVHYDASKGGVVMMTRSLAKELGAKGIRVVAVAPGGIATPGAAKATAGTGAPMTTEQIAQIYARLPIPRAGEPDDIGKVVLFLASDLASYVTGATLVVDGGWLVV